MQMVKSDHTFEFNNLFIVSLTKTEVTGAS